MFWRKRRTPLRKTTPRAVLFKQLFYGAVALSLCAAIGYTVWHGTRVESLTIKTITVRGGETIGQSIIRSIVEKHLSGSYVKLIPHRFAWFYPHDLIVDDIAAIDRVKTVSLDRISGTELMVEYSEYHPEWLWCDNSSVHKCVFLDNEGYAFSSAPRLIGTALLHYSDTRRSPQVGTHAISQKQSDQFKAFIDAVALQYGYVITHVEQTAPTEVAYHINGVGTLRTSLTQDTAETLENLHTILASREFSHLQGSTFEYIDLRYGNKVFVKEKATVETVASSTVPTD